MRAKLKLVPFVLVVCLCGWALYVGTHGKAPGPGIELHANQHRDDLEQMVVAAIDRAKESVTLATYGLSDPKVLEALERAVARGCTVTALCDSKRTRKLPDGIALHKRHGPGLMHQKFLIIDGKEVWIGTANLTRASLRNHGNLILTLHSPELAAALTPLVEKRRPLKFQSDQLTLYTLPSREALGAVIETLEQAQKTIRVAMFTFTHPHLVDALIDAHERGVQVTALVDGYSGRGASKRAVARLREAGVPTRLSMGPELLHHKWAWIDEETLILGSANWTRAAFTKNDDDLLILHSLSSAQNKKLRKTWKRSALLSCADKEKISD